MMEKELAHWIYYEDGSNYYCSSCIEKRIQEINDNKEFADYINYEDGDTFGYYQDYANEDYEVTCYMCETQLYSMFDVNTQPNESN